MQGESYIADLVGMTEMRRDQGFTLVELMTVVVVLGALAAMSVQTFIKQQDKAHRAAVVSDARSILLAQATRMDGTGFTDSPLELASAGYSRSEGVNEPVIKLEASGYLACLSHSSLSEWLIIDGASQTTTWAPDNLCA